MVMQSSVTDGEASLRRLEPSHSVSKAAGSEKEPHIAETAYAVLCGDVPLIDVSHLSGEEMLAWALSRP